MAGDGGLRDLKRIIFDPSNSGLVHLQLESASSQTFAQENKSRHRLMKHSIIRPSTSSQESMIEIADSDSSLIRSLFDHGVKLGEERLGIVRAGRGFRMGLHAVDSLGLVAQSFHCLVIQIDPINDDFRRLGICRDGKAMILRSDLHPASLQIFDGLISSAMAEFELEGLSSKSLPQNLMSETNTKNRHSAFD